MPQLSFLKQDEMREEQASPREAYQVYGAHCEVQLAKVDCPFRET